MKANRSTRVGIGVAVFALALLIRLIGIGWGLKGPLHNQSYHPDEPVIFAYSQAIEPTKLSFTPGFYNYGTFYLTMLRVATDMTTAYTGGPGETDDGYWQWVSRADLAGRILSALAGAATCVLLFFIGWRRFGLLGGIAAGLLIAVAPGHVVHSRFQTVDIIATFFLAVSALFALKMLPDESEDVRSPLWRLALFSGIFAGLSAGTKYTGIFGLLTLFVVLAMLPKEEEQAANLIQRLKLGLIGLGACVAAFLITTPGALLDSAKFAQDFGYEMVHTSTGHGLVFSGTSSGFIYHIGNLIVGIGLIPVALGIGGLGYAAAKKHPWALAVAAFFVVYFLLIGRAEVKFLRYTFPLYIGIAMGVGYAITELSKKNLRGAIVVLIVVIGGLDQGSLVGTAKETEMMAAPDPRDEAAQYIKDESTKIPDATYGFAKDPWTWSVPMFPDATIPRMPMGPKYLAAYKEAISDLINQYNDRGLALSRAGVVARASLMAGVTQPKPEFLYSPIPPALGQPWPKPTEFHDFDVRLVTQFKPTFIAITSLEAGAQERLRLLPGLTGDEKAAVDQYNEFMDALQRDYQLDKTFGQPSPEVEDMLYVQPTVLVWKRKSTN